MHGEGVAGATVTVERRLTDALATIALQVSAIFVLLARGFGPALPNDAKTIILVTTEALERTYWLRVCNSLRGNVVLLFQPAEEIVEGAKKMIK